MHHQLSCRLAAPRPAPAGPVMCAVFFTALKLFEGNPAGILPFLQASPAVRDCCVFSSRCALCASHRPPPLASNCVCRRSGCPRCAPAWQVRSAVEFCSDIFLVSSLWTSTPVRCPGIFPFQSPPNHHQSASCLLCPSLSPVWGPYNLASFRFIPEHLRVLCGNCAGGLCAAALPESSPLSHLLPR